VNQADGDASDKFYDAGSTPAVGGFTRGTARRLRLAFGSLRVRVFRWWFLSQILSASGTMTQSVAQAWLVLRLGGNGVVLGAVTACTFSPLLLGGAWAGALVDQFDRRHVLLCTQVSFIAISSTLGVLTLLGSIRLWIVFVAAAAAGSVNAVDQPARQVYVFDLVGRDRMANAVGLNEVVINVSRVLGPAVGGVLLVTSGVAACFFFNAATFVPPLLVLWQFRPTLSLSAQRQAGQVRKGLLYAWSQPAIRGVLFMAAASGMLFNLGVALPLIATRVFHIGGGGYGLMLGTFGLGAVGGGVMAATGNTWPSGRSVRLLALVSGLVVLGTAASPDIGAEFAGLALCGLSSVWFIARANALVQLRSAPDMRGRVMGLWTMALPGMTPLTALLVGLVCDELGPQKGFGLAGIALVLSAAVAWHALRD
jgi:predicted MFS family arabinose efflux permease